MPTNRILFLPTLGLAIGLDTSSARTTRELAYDCSRRFSRECGVTATAGAWVWEGHIVCDDLLEEVRYEGSARRAATGDFTALASVTPSRDSAEMIHASTPMCFLPEFSDSRDEPDGPAVVAPPATPMFALVAQEREEYLASLDAIADAWETRNYQAFSNWPALVLTGRI